ncbi:nuclease (SNase domain-containing protein) [Methanothermococcus okinawensis IH1]|uniref:Nuclease (SNase domain-containing protein) n=1 Tax=Methanothermococcus okinawensis (strain DSM 14208 / JCM 11175 / IH1) TaxID=647113 RepID=F8ALL6_METOI|nr:nuclease (SNase domain-containing protein) [Methanothermococcus okinawensis IH1]
MSIFIIFSGCLDIFSDNNGNNNNYNGNSYEYQKFLNSHEHFTAKVIKITDGDTIWVMDKNGKKYKIRLLGVDTPEIYHKNSPEKFYINNHPISNITYLKVWGYKAKDYAERMLGNKTVIVVFDNEAPRKGYYGRYLAYIFIDGDDFNEELLKNGYARVYVSNFELKTKYLKEERYAKEHKIGLWNVSNN